MTKIVVVPDEEIELNEAHVVGYNRSGYVLYTEVEGLIKISTSIWKSSEDAQTYLNTMRSYL